MKDFSVDDFAALVRIDWADKKHDICELPTGTKDYQWSVISSKPDQLHQWATSLEQRYPGRTVAVAESVLRAEGICYVRLFLLARAKSGGLLTIILTSSNVKYFA